MSSKSDSGVLLQPSRPSGCTLLLANLSNLFCYLQNIHQFCPLMKCTKNLFSLTLKKLRLGLINFWIKWQEPSACDASALMATSRAWEQLWGDATVLSAVMFQLDISLISDFKNSGRTLWLLTCSFCIDCLAISLTITSQN